MAKVKVLVLYPTGFTGLGLGDVSGSDVVELEESVAKTVVDADWAEYVREPKAKKTETATVKLKDKDA